MSNIEVKKIIEPILSSDGAGVKLKRSIGVDPDYFDPFLMLDEFGSDNKMIILVAFLLILTEVSRRLLTCCMENLNMKIALVLKVE